MDHLGGCSSRQGSLRAPGDCAGILDAAARGGSNYAQHVKVLGLFWQPLNADGFGAAVDTSSLGLSGPQLEPGMIVSARR